MITSWRVCNFKSVDDETKLELAPLTLFTGANSAGKSTIIQSMLLTAQTVQSSVLSRPVVLNGHMARLGSFKDIVSSGDEEKKNISIGFEVKTAVLAGRNISPTGTAWRPMFIGPGTSVEKVAVSFSFSAMPGPNEVRDKELLRLQPSLIETDLSVTYVEKGVRSSDQVVIRRSDEAISVRRAQLKLNGADLPEASLEGLRYTVTKPPRSRGYSGRVEGLGLYPELVGAYMQHFLPRSFVGRFDEVSASVAAQVALLTEPTSYRRQTNHGFTARPIPSEVVNFVSTLLRPLLGESSPVPIAPFARSNLASAISRLVESKNPEEFATMVRRLPPRDQSSIYSILGGEKARISTLLRGSRAPSYDLEVQYPNDQLSYGMDFIQNFFGSSVKYLGPLRDEPKPVYPLAGTVDPADVGFRGEHTAAVLDLNRNKLVDYVPSSQFSSEWVELSQQKATLSGAVQDWLEYMGVGRDFFTSDLGKLGHELKIRTAGSDLQHDLTQVGVGVSQVLPILVLALLADAGATLIFEQPELHLHPRVQSRLADFFVSMTRLGKQCIVETHSEYIINRLRLRAASEKGSEVANSSIIYFVEKHQSTSAYRRVSIDKLGGLDNWPAGFFDEGELATTALLRQSLKKRKGS